MSHHASSTKRRLSSLNSASLRGVLVNLQAMLRLSADVHDNVVTVMMMLLLCRRSGLLGSCTGNSSVLLAAIPHIAAVHPLPQGTVFMKCLLWFPHIAGVCPLPQGTKPPASSMCM